jgi:hypothetical protein
LQSSGGKLDRFIVEGVNYTTPIVGGQLDFFPESFYHSDPVKQLVHVLEKLSNIGGLVPVETRVGPYLLVLRKGRKVAQIG